METREIKLWQRAVAMLCAIAMLAMLFPTGMMQTFAVTLDESNGFVATAVSDVLYADSTDGTNSTTVTASGLTADASEEITYQWSVTSGNDLVTLANDTTDTVTVTAVTGASGAVALTVNATVKSEGTEQDGSPYSATVNISVYNSLEGFTVSVTASPDSYVGATLTAAAKLDEGDVTTGYDVVYQWYNSNGEAISGATSYEYQPSEAGSYSVKATYPQDDTAYIAAASATSTTVAVSLNTVAVSATNIASGKYTYGDDVEVTLTAPVEGTFYVTAGTTTANAETEGVTASGSDSSYTATVTLDTTAAGTDKAFTYSFTPTDAATYDKVEETTVNYDVAQAELAFTVTVDGKNFDNTTDVLDDNIVITVSAETGLVNSGTGTIALVLADGSAPDKDDFVFASAGDVAGDTVQVTAASGVTFAVKVDNSVDENYTANVTYTDAIITANDFTAADVATAAKAYYVDGDGINWYQKDVVEVTVTAVNGYTVSASLTDKAATDGFGDSAGVAPVDGKLIVYVANSNSEIALVTLDGEYQIDTTAPSVSYTVSGGTDIDFDKDKVTYTITVTDNDGSGVDTGKIYYYISSDNNNPTGSDWVLAIGETNGTDQYTFTVTTTSASGYVFVKATDNVGNEGTTENGIRALVIESVVPDVTLTAEDADTYTQSKSITVAVDDNVATPENTASPYVYSGIDTVTYSVATGTYASDDAFKAVVDKLVTDKSLVDNNTPTAMDGIPACETCNIEIALSIDEIGELKDYTGPVTVAVTATDFCGNTTTEYITVVLDNTPATVSVSMDNAVEANDDGVYYYKADNGDITVTFTDDIALTDGNYTVTLSSDASGDENALGTKDALDEKTLELVGQETTASITFTATEVATLKDGKITITVEAEDAAAVAAGEGAVNPTTAINAVGEETGDSSGVVVTDLTATFVLDTVAPVVTQISTDETSGGNYNGTFYYNEETVKTTLTIEDANLDSTLVEASMSEVPANNDSDAAVGTVDQDALNVTFTMSDEGTYSDFEVTATDKAGNALVLDGDVEVTVEDEIEVDAATDDSEDFSPVGKVTLTNSKVIDTTAPTAEITYTASVAPNLYAADNTVATASGTAYYNKTATATVAFSDANPMDYSRLYATEAGTVTETATGATLTGTDYTVSATATFSTSDDGSYTFGAYGTDLAGNSLTVQEYTPGTDESTDPAVSPVKTENCKDTYAAAYTIVQDTEAPTYTFALATAATNQSTYTIDGTTRYYFNAAYTATATVTDDNYDAALITVAMGANNVLTANSATQTVSGYTDATLTESNERVFTNTVSEEGAYQYQIYGADKAGNALVPSDGQPDNLLEDNTVPVDTTATTTTNANVTYQYNEEEEAELSYYVVVDTTAPEGNLVISNEDGEDYYEIDTDLSVAYAAPYRSETEASVAFAVDSSEYSPVIMEYAIGSTLNTANLDEEQVITVGSTVEEDTYEYQKTATATITGEQVFTINNYLITDLAGNTSAGYTTDDEALEDWSSTTNKIYLDVTPPEVDELAPTISVSGTADSNYGPDGQELYNSDVTFDITINDFSYTSGSSSTASTSSGIGDVTWEIFVNGESRDSGVFSEALENSFTEEYDDATLTYTISEELDFASSDYNYNDLELVITAIDNADNGNTLSYDFGIDVTDPTISVTYDNNSPDPEFNTYFNASRTATITVTERNFDADNTVVSVENLDGSVVPTISSWTKSSGSTANGDDTTYTTVIIYDADGLYTFDITTTDLASNEMSADVDYNDSAAPQEFYIDLTFPTIAVSYDNNSSLNTNYYNATRTATVVINEHNFDESRVEITMTATDDGAAVAVPAVVGWTSSGDDNIATISYSADAYYTFDIAFADMAGNIADDYLDEDFYVDTTAPVLTITGVENGSANKGDVIPVVEYSDTNYDADAVSVVLTGAVRDNVAVEGSTEVIHNGEIFTFNNFEETQAVDDIYTLTATIVDKAGNESTETILFSVNRFGSNYIISDATTAILNQFLNAEPELVVTEINADTLSDITLTVYQDSQRIDLVEGEDYTVTQTGGNGQWYAYQYTVSAENFASDGVYSLNIYSVDAAGNISENTLDTKNANVDFAVDKTAPVVIVTNLEEGVTYPEELWTVLVSASDNMKLVSGAVVLDGAAHTAWDSDAVDANVASNQDFTFDIDDSSLSAHAVQISFTDIAGNTTTVSVADFYVTTNLLVRWYNNKVVFYSSIAGAGVCGGGALWFILLKKKLIVTAVEETIV